MKTNNDSPKNVKFPGQENTPCWTETQGQAIGQRGTSLLVSASAGSGKTTVMIERIVSMLTDKEADVNDLLVLTFTNASAADMKIKLRRRLEEKLESISDENIQSRKDIQKQIELLPAAGIGTFHKFCGELIRTYFNIAGISPDFTVLDETGAIFLKSEVLDEIITKKYAECSHAIDAFCVNRRTDTFKELLISISDFLTSRGDPDEWLAATAYAGYEEDFAQNIAMCTIIEHYNRAGQYYLKKFNDYLITAEASNAIKVVPFIKECQVMAVQLSDARSYDDLHNLAVTANFSSLSGAGRGKGFDDYSAFKDTHGQFKELIKKVSEHYAITKDVMFLNLRRDKELVTEVIILVREFISVYSALKLDGNKLDFNDLEKYACVVLSDAEVAGAVRQKYKFIFVDEYQDTNPMQEKILSLIGGTRNIFMVGDIKQSIYGFRGCEAAIFAGKMTDFDKNLTGKVVKLNENFRSDSRLLQFVNSVFGKIMKDVIADIDYDATSKFSLGVPYPQEKKEDSVPAAPVEIVLLNNGGENVTGENKVDAHAAQAAVIVKRISELLKTRIWDARKKVFRDVRLNDIAILARSRNHFDVLLEALQQEGLDACVSAEQNAVDLFEISLLNNMLFAVSNFYNDVPLTLLMQSFVFGFTPDELAQIKIESSAHETANPGQKPAGKNEKFYNLIVYYIEKNKNSLSQKLLMFIGFLHKYRALAKKYCVVDVLTIFLTECKVFDLLSLVSEGHQMISNIHRYLNKLRGASYAATVSNFLYLLENDLLEIKIQSSGGLGERIQIMTMHSSKGLEFPIVIIYDIAAAFNTSDTRQLMVIDKKCGLCVYSVDSDEFIKTNSIARLGALAAAQRVMVAEEMRLFYVALTRAKNHLLIVGTCNIQKLKQGCEDYDIACAKNYLHFLAPTVFAAVKDDCFLLNIYNFDDIKILNNNFKKNVLAGAYDNDFTEQLKAVYTKDYPFKAAVTMILKNSVSSLVFGKEESLEQSENVFIRNEDEPQKQNKQQPIDSKLKSQTQESQRTNSGSQHKGKLYGTNFHKVMQSVDFNLCAVHSNRDIQKCVEIIAPLVKNYRIFKELVFLQTLKQNETEILVQGIIDLLAVKDNQAIIIDYKTTNAEPEKLVELYTAQLSHYADAVRQAIKNLTLDVYIYSTVNQKLIKIDVDKT